MTINLKTRHNSHYRVTGANKHNNHISKTVNCQSFYLLAYILRRTDIVDHCSNVSQTKVAQGKRAISNGY